MTRPSSDPYAESIHKSLNPLALPQETSSHPRTIQSGPRQVDRLMSWTEPFDKRTWAIESAGGLGYLLAQQLVARG